MRDRLKTGLTYILQAAIHGLPASLLISLLITHCGSSLRQC